ncbi:MAG: DUF4038 domain-containing protein [Isosphaeraceae bacterium]
MPWLFVKSRASWKPTGCRTHVHSRESERRPIQHDRPRRHLHGPSAKVVRGPAFWAGGKTWRARYASPEIGVHSYVTSCTERDEQGVHQVTGKVEVVPYKGDNPLYRHGPVRVARDRRHFAYADGTPFFWLGDSWWMGLCERLQWPEEVRTLTEDRKTEGLPVIQIVAGL